MEKQLKTILIADDEPDILDLLGYNFEKEGYQIFTVENGKDAISTSYKAKPDVILLDIMMPGVDGIEVCRRLRSDPIFDETVIIILTARGEEYSEIAGFDAGADDYVTKPVRFRVLMKRIESLINRKSKNDLEIIDLPPFVIDRTKYLLFFKGKEIHLPRKEFELFFLLASNPNKVVTRSEILSSIWGQQVIVVDRTIDVHIRRIRKKIGSEYIHTVKGIGYRLVV